MSNLDAKQPLYQMLKHPELRKKILGSKVLFIDDIGMDGGDLDKTDWENVHFKDVEFRGRFEQRVLKNVVFEECTFVEAGIFSQTTEDVTFTKCKTLGGCYLMGYRAKNLVFDQCDFTENDDTNPNHWGAVSYTGETLFKKCKAKHVDIGGETKVHYDGCEFADMEMNCGLAIKGEENFADVVVENCTLKGKVTMMTSNIASLTIKNTTFETFLSPETIRDNLTLENVKGNYLWIEKANSPLKNINVKNCVFTAKGRNEGTFDIWDENNPVRSETMSIDGIKCGVGGPPSASGSFQTAKITTIKNVETPRFAIMLQGESVRIENVKASNKSTFENAPGQGKMPNVVISNFYVANLADFKGVTLPTLIIDGYKGDTLDFADAKIGRLEIKNSRVETLLDLTNAHVGSGEFSTLSGSKKIKVITKGSNLDVKDGTLYVVPPKA